MKEQRLIEWKKTSIALPLFPPLLLLISLSMTAFFCSCEKLFDDTTDTNTQICALYTASEDLSCIIFDEGECMFVGFDSIGNKYLIAGVIDSLSYEWRLDHQSYILFDSLDRPTTIMTEDALLMFGSYNESTFHITYIDSTGVVTEYDNVSYSQKNSCNTKTIGDAEFWRNTLTTIEGVKTSVDVAKAFVYTTPGLEMLSSILSYVGTIIGGDIGLFITTGGSLIQGINVGTIRSLGYSMAAEFWVRNREFVEDHTGMIKVRILNVEQTDGDKFRVNYRISGINDLPEGNLRYFFHIVNISNDAFERKYFSTSPQNGTFYEYMETMGAGDYRITLFVEDECHPLMWYDTKLAKMYDLFEINTIASPTEGGTVTGGGRYPANTTITLTATANNGYEFTHWNDGSTLNTRTITVERDATYTAYFTIPLYSINTIANPSVGGSVTGGGSYPAGTTITLSAVPNPNYVFNHWNDGLTEQNRTITVYENKTYTAYFGESYLNLAGQWTFNQTHSLTNPLSVNLVLVNSNSNGASYQANNLPEGYRLSLFVRPDRTVSIELWDPVESNYHYEWVQWATFEGVFNDTYTSVSGSSYMHEETSYIAPTGWQVNDPWSFHR